MLKDGFGLPRQQMLTTGYALTMPRAPKKTRATRPPAAAPRFGSDDGKPEDLRARWRVHALALAGLTALVLLAYANSFRTGLPYDNAIVIQNDARIRAVTPENLRLILTQEYWYRYAITGLYRPFTTLSYLFNYAILGNGPAPLAYHWVNFGLHAVNVALVYGLALIVLGELRLAFFLAAIWGVHPALTESVTNVVGRADLLAGFGVLAGLLCHIRGARAAGWRKVGWLAGLAMAGTAGFFSKESGVVLPGAMALYDFTFPRAAAWRRRLPGYVTTVAAVAGFLAIRAYVLAGSPSPTVPFTDDPVAGAGFWTGRLTAIGVMARYLWLLIWPARLSFDYSYNQIPLFTWRFDSLQDWGVPLALALCASLAALAVAGYRRRKPLFFFIAFFFVAFLPTSNILVPSSIMAERFLYLPSIGFAGCVVWGLVACVPRIERRWPGVRTAAAVAGAILCILFIARTSLRNLDWTDDSTLFASGTIASPNSYRTHMMLAGSMRPWQVDEAVRESERSLAIVQGLPEDSKPPLAFVQAGLWYRIKGERAGSAQGGVYWYRKSLETLLQAAGIDQLTMDAIRRENARRGKRFPGGGTPQLYLELGRTYLRLGQPREAIEALTQGRRFQQKPEYSAEMAQAYRALGEPERAAISLLEGWILDSTAGGLASEAAAIYRQLDPQGCAVVAAGLNLDCPLVHGHMCQASRDMSRLYLSAGVTAGAEDIRKSAVQDLGCPASLFR